MNKSIENKLNALYEKWAGNKPQQIEKMPQSGSDRQYFRLTDGNKTVLGVYNTDLKENKAFLSFTESFIKNNLPVPKIYEIDEEQKMYLLEDLGDTTLYAFLKENSGNESYSPELIQMYKKVVGFLPEFQVVGGEVIDYNLCYPRDKFDRQSMMWDLNYFKYYFLKLAKIPFDEQRLEDDYKTFTDFLLSSDTSFFMYRDFQSRNIMLHNNEPCFIDYQGGRKGALQYDIASLLYDAKANMPREVREELLESYLDALEKKININREQFTTSYYAFVLIRIMQAMGAYGFRGFYEKKEHFLQSIPYALKNLEWILNNRSFPFETPMLFEVLERLTKSERIRSIGMDKKKLKVSVNSFSYKKGIPVDESGNGGGFVFDCRAVHNPGRYNKYKHVNGKNPDVIKFFEKEPEMHSFLDMVFAMVDTSVEKYLQRNFGNLMVNFGCTGGQHRSVYSADRLAKHLKEKYDLDVYINHREQEIVESIEG